MAAIGVTRPPLSAELLRSDVKKGVVSDSRAAEHAFRRPSWFSYRRVALLLSQAEEVELVYAGTSAFVVRLVASGRFSLGSALASRQAYVLWVDQIDERGSWSFSFDGSTTWKQVSLVPAVEPDPVSPPVQFGYAAGEVVDWSPELTCTADPDDNPARLSIFTDAELTGVTAPSRPYEHRAPTEGRWSAL